MFSPIVLIIEFFILFSPSKSFILVHISCCYNMSLSEECPNQSCILSMCLHPRGKKKDIANQSLKNELVLDSYSTPRNFLHIHLLSSISSKINSFYAFLVPTYFSLLLLLWEFSHPSFLQMHQSKFYTILIDEYCHHFDLVKGCPGADNL